jgi:hypothetical protein
MRRFLRVIRHGWEWVAHLHTMAWILEKLDQLAWWKRLMGPVFGITAATVAAISGVPVWGWIIIGLFVALIVLALLLVKQVPHKPISSLDAPQGRVGLPIADTVAIGPQLVMDFPRGIEHIRFDDRDFWILRNVGQRAATSVRIDTAYLGNYRLEFDGINAIGPSGHGADVARVSYMGYRSESFWGTNRDGFSNPEHALKNALESVADLVDGTRLPLTIHYKDGNAQGCTRQVVHYGSFDNRISVTTEDCTEPGLEFVEWHGGNRSSLPSHWPNSASTPSWISIRNIQVAPSITAQKVTARLEFVDSQRTQVLIVPEAVWFEQKVMSRTGRVERWAHEVEIEGGDEQAFVFFVETPRREIIPHKDRGEPLEPLTYDHWNVKLIVSSDNLPGFEGTIGFTLTRNAMPHDHPAFTKLRDVPPRLQSIQRSR